MECKGVKTRRKTKMCRPPGHVQGEKNTTWCLFGAWGDVTSKYRPSKRCWMEKVTALSVVLSVCYKQESITQ